MYCNLLFSANCAPNAPTNGDVKPKLVPHGQTTTYTCNERYTLVGTATQTCELGSLSIPQPTCQSGKQYSSYWMNYVPEYRPV